MKLRSVSRKKTRRDETKFAGREKPLWGQQWNFRGEDDLIRGLESVLSESYGPIRLESDPVPVNQKRAVAMPHIKRNHGSTWSLHRLLWGTKKDLTGPSSPEYYTLYRWWETSPSWFPKAHGPRSIPRRTESPSCGRSAPLPRSMIPSIKPSYWDSIAEARPLRCVYSITQYECLSWILANVHR